MVLRTKRRTVTAGIIILVASLALGFGACAWLMGAMQSASPSQPADTPMSDIEKSVILEDDNGTYETTKPALDSYSVAPDMPRALYIEKLSIAARIMPMGVTADNSVEAPRNIYDAGWYTGSAKPNEAGAMFIDGHASGASRLGLFAYLDTLQAGDYITVEKGDGQQLSYVVRAVDTYDANAVDMTKALSPYTKGAKGLNLMTCTGSWVPDEQTYDQRVVVYTEQVE